MIKLTWRGNRVSRDDKARTPDDESQNRLVRLFWLVSHKIKLHSHALIERVNTRRLRCASKKSIFVRLFRTRVLFLPTWSTRPHLTSPSLTPEFANPYLASRTVSQQTSLTDFTPVDFRDPAASSPAHPVPFSPLFLCLFVALIARLSNCHFLRQIVLSRVGVTDTRIKLTEEKKKREGVEQREGREGRKRGRLKDAVRDKPWGRGDACKLRRR